MRASLLSFAFAATAYAQQSSAYADTNTGITFQRYYDTTGFSFGLVIPESPGSDFIGQMVMPTNGTGYAGVALAAEMTGSLLVVAWPNEDSVVSSFRETSGYTSPGVYTNSSMSLSSISNGTFVNTTHMSYTFLCSGCLGSSLAFDASSENVVIGWAISDGAVTNPSSASTATFEYHSAGFGNFGLNLTGAKSASYATWAAMATATPSTGNTTTSGGSNSTCSSTSSNVTATASNTTYDYIIAGAGPAGIIVAQRLTESGKSVLLLERGAASTYATGGRSTVSWNDTVTQYDVPSMAYYLTTASDTSEYCTDVASMAGCILGGGTMVNALMFVRPQEADFDDKWPTGWKWSDVSSAADRLYERNPGTTLASSDNKRYDQGAWNVLSAFFSDLGWSHVDAIESPNEKTEVYSYPPWDIQNGLRAGPVKSYYPLAEAKSNFKLTLNTKVIRAVRNGTTISGVEVEDSTGARQIININTDGSVILAAGALSTPRILFNSGIGPTEQITTVKNGCASVTLPAESDWINLPVGQNLKDHPIFTLTFNTTASNSSSMLASAFTSPNTTNVDLFAQASGPLAQSGQRLNFWSSLNTTDGTRFFQGTCNSPSTGTIRIKLYLTHGATSSGVLGITSQGATEFTTEPLMTTDADKSAVITFIDNLLSAAKNSTLIVPSDSTATGSSLVSSYVSGDHFVGTAMMGTTNDGTAVVDTDTKVFGTDNLFVVDASIHPDLPTGNTQAIVMVAAEQAAAKILALSGSNSTLAITTPSNSTSIVSPSNSTSVASPSNSTSVVSPSNSTSDVPPAGTSSAVSADSGAQTTLTVQTTQIITITSCAATITNCPARASESTSVMVVTQTIDLSTTVCPVSEASSASSKILASFAPSAIASIASSQRASSIASVPTSSPRSSTGAQLASSTSATQVSVASTSAAQSTAVSSSSPAQSSAALSSSVPTTTPASGPQTALTVVTTQIRTITSCAASITDCPARASESTSVMVVTDTIVLSTTVPVADASSATSALLASYSTSEIAAVASPTSSAQSSSVTSAPASGPQTILTVMTTEIRTITSCAASITDCPVRASESTSVMVVTNTIVLSTTVPVADASSATSALLASYSTSEIAAVTASSTSSAQPSSVTTTPASGPQTILTVMTTEIRTITSCAASITDCPARASESTSVMVVTDTVVLSTTVAVADASSATSALLASFSASEIAVATASSTGSAQSSSTTSVAAQSSATSSSSPAQISGAESSVAQTSATASEVAATATTLATTTSASGPQTTLTVLTTQIYTVTSCAASITNCPANASESTSAIIVTETVALTTTVCPVAEASSASSAILKHYRPNPTGTGFRFVPTPSATATATTTGATVTSSSAAATDAAATDGSGSDQDGEGDDDDECEAD